MSRRARSRGEPNVRDPQARDLALADYTKAIELDPRDGAKFNDRGNIHWNKQDINLAIADYSQASS